jgi:hypothetical protein
VREREREIEREREREREKERDRKIEKERVERIRAGSICFARLLLNYCHVASAIEDNEEKEIR